MSYPTYRLRGDNSPLTQDDYISKTVGCNTNSGIANKNDSSFLTTYPVQGNVRPVSSAPSPALPTTRFYITNFIVKSPNNIRGNSDFARFSNNEEYVVFLDNYFMYEANYYMNNSIHIELNEIIFNLK